MPVSLERLIAEVEPSVITEEVTRECIQVSGSDQDAIEDKKATMRFKDVECLAFSFRNLARIDNLHGLDRLTKLQLDNNHIPKIENIAHLTNLTWLDLSFNKIAKIEGLETLTKLSDLSLYNNAISVIEGLETLTDLNVLSLGNNAITALDSVGYLRLFTNLRMVNLAGNPLAKDRDYKGYVLSHLKNLTYLDYRRVAAGDVNTALEQHQDEVLELREREEQAELEATHAAERKAHAALMAEANLDGVESLLEDMVNGDPDWAKMNGVPGLLEGWADVREKFTVATEEFKTIILEAHARKKGEHASFRAALASALNERDGEARRLIAEFEKSKKAVARHLADAASSGDDVEHHVSAIKAKLMGLKDSLLDIEMDTLEVVAQLCQEFDRAYTEMAEANKLQYNAYFTQVRDLKNTFCSSLSAAALPFLEKYGSSGTDNPELEAMPEEAQLLLSDKDSMMSAVQTSHDAHIQRIDALEDRLTASEIRRANELADNNSKWEAQRHRDRTAEILAYLERNVVDLDAMTVEAEGEAGQPDA